MRRSNWRRKQPEPDKGSQRGLTLLELITALAISAILLAAATPSIQNQLLKYRLDAESRRLFSDLQFARMRAIFLRQSTVLCPDDGQGQCADQPLWQSGWLIYPDQNRDRVRQSTEPVIRYGAPMPQLSGLTSTGRLSARFLPDGSAAGSNLTLRLCAAADLPWRRITLSNSGRLRLIQEPPPAPCG